MGFELKTFQMVAVTIYYSVVPVMCSVSRYNIHLFMNLFIHLHITTQHNIIKKLEHDDQKTVLFVTSCQGITAPTGIWVVIKADTSLTRLFQIKSDDQFW